ncbi:MAG: hypothetical protein OXG30_15720 [bacterium]|nr:hypothetical protein [bacterium]
MTSKDNGGNDPSPPDRAGDGMDLLIGWRAGGTEAADAPAAERNAGEDAEPGAEAASVPASDPAAMTTADLAASQQRILALLEDLAPKQAETTTGDAGTDLQEAATAIQAATEWVSDIRAAIEAVLAATGKSIQNLNAAEKSLDESVKKQGTALLAIHDNVERFTGSGNAFLDKFGTAWEGALEGFRAEWRRTRRWTVPVLAAVLVLMLPTLPVLGATASGFASLSRPSAPTKSIASGDARKTARKSLGRASSLWMRISSKYRPGIMALPPRDRAECRCSIR